MKKQPLISIVTPSYNQGHFIAATIESILNQSYTNIEYIIMDGGSTDNTIEVIQRYSEDERLSWVSEPDKGQSDAINKGMRRATGDILAYLNSDDVYLPGSFQTVADTFTQFPDIDLIYGICHTIDTEGKRLKHTFDIQEYTLEHGLTQRWRVAQPATFWRRHVMDNIGLFDETLHYTMDYDYWLRAALDDHKVKPVQAALAALRLHDTTKTSTNDEKMIADFDRILEKVYQREDIAHEVAQLKPLIESYQNIHAADKLWRNGRRKAARPYLYKTLTHPGYFRARFRAAIMLVDSYLNTSAYDNLIEFYRNRRT